MLDHAVLIFQFFNFSKILSICDVNFFSPCYVELGANSKYRSEKILL